MFNHFWKMAIIFSLSIYSFLISILHTSIVYSFIFSSISFWIILLRLFYIFTMLTPKKYLKLYFIQLIKNLRNSKSKDREFSRNRLGLGLNKLIKNCGLWQESDFLTFKFEGNEGEALIRLRAILCCWLKMKSGALCYSIFPFAYQRVTGWRCPKASLLC